MNHITNQRERLLLKDMANADILAQLRVEAITPATFDSADAFLERQLFKGSRPRTKEFLRQKLEENPGLFISLTLDGEIGVVQGFPRDDYLLLSEMAVDKRFRRRGFGSLLLREFEKVAKQKGFKRVKLGAEDEAANFYLSQGYSPSLFVQVEEKRENEAVKLIGHDRVLSISRANGLSGIEVKAPKCDLSLLREIEVLVKPVSCQFLFSRELQL